MISTPHFLGVTCDEDEKESDQGQNCDYEQRLLVALRLLNEKEMELADTNSSKTTLEANVKIFQERLRNILVFHVKQRRSPKGLTANFFIAESA